MVEKKTLEFEVDDEVVDDEYQIDEEKIVEYRKKHPRKTPKIKTEDVEEEETTKKKKKKKKEVSDTVEKKREELRKLYYTHPELIEMVGEIEKKKLPNISKMKEQELDERLYIAKHHSSKLLNQTLSDSGVDLIASLTSYILNDQKLYDEISKDKALKSLIHNYIISEYLVYIQSIFKIIIIYGSHVFRSVYNNKKKKMKEAEESKE